MKTSERRVKISGSCKIPTEEHAFRLYVAGVRVLFCSARGRYHANAARSSVRLVCTRSSRPLLHDEHTQLRTESDAF